MVTQVLVAVHVDTAEVHTAEALRERVTALEAAGVHLLTFAPRSDGGLSAVEAASFAVAWTERVGLAPVLNPVHAEPFHVSNQLSSLDRLSRGRAGWWVQVADDVAHARSHGTGPVGDEDPPALVQEVSEVVEAVRLLWDSWEDGALVADRETGRFLDADRVRHVDFVGRRFSVKGPALLPRPPQGQVPVLAEDATVDADVRGVTVLPVGAGTAHDVAARGLRAKDGPVVVRLVPPGRPGEGDVVGQALATLRAAGLAAPPPEPGRTLRDVLGLPRPAGRLAAARRADEIGARR